MEFSKEITEEVKAFIESQSKSRLTIWYGTIMQEIIIRNFKFNKVCYTDDLIACSDFFKDLSHEFITCYIINSNVSHIVDILGVPQTNGSYRTAFQVRNFMSKFNF